MYSLEKEVGTRRHHDWIRQFIVFRHTGLCGRYAVVRILFSFELFHL